MSNNNRQSVIGSIKSIFSSKKGSAEFNEKTPELPPPPPYSAQDTSGLAPNQTPARRPSLLSRNQSGRSKPKFSAKDISTVADPFAFLAQFDCVFLIDDSGSMAGKRWAEVRTAMEQIAPECMARDDNGVDICFLNDPHVFLNCKIPSTIEDIFSKVRCSRSTPTGKRVREILSQYLEGYEHLIRVQGLGPAETGKKPLNLIVITDGEPNDYLEENDLSKVLTNVADRLDVLDAPSYQIGVQFFQVGNDKDAKAALEKLDNNLGGRVSEGQLRDIVDTCTFDTRIGGSSALTHEAILKAVLGAVNRRVDHVTLKDRR